MVQGTVDLDGVLQLEYYNLKETFKGDLSLKEMMALMSSLHQRLVQNQQTGGGEWNAG